jgi:hypothetical protein
MMKTMGHARGKPRFAASQPGLKTGCSRSWIMFSQTLGIALGDWTTDSAGPGYEGGAIVLGSNAGSHRDTVLSNQNFTDIIVLGCIYSYPPTGSRS